MTTKRVMPAVLSASDVHTPRGGQDLAWVSRARLLFIDGGWCGVGPGSAHVRVFFLLNSIYRPAENLQTVKSLTRSQAAKHAPHRLIVIR